LTNGRGGAIVPSHNYILFIRVTTFIDKDLCIIPSKTLYTEENSHKGSKHLYI